MRGVLIGLFPPFVIALAVACGERLAHPPYSPQPTSALVPISAEPPPARVEVVPPSPEKGAAWIDGEWSNVRRRWVWNPGRWVKPIPGATYSPWTTTRSPEGQLYMAPGTWRDADGGVIDPPPPLAFAVPEPGIVYDPSGEVARTGSVAVPTSLDASADGPDGSDARSD